MKRFIDIPTRTKFFLGFGIVIGFLIIVIITANWGISGIQRSLNDIFTTEFPNSTGILKLKSVQDEVRVALLTMMSMSGRAERETWHQVIRDSSAQGDMIMQGLVERNKGEPKILHRLEELNAIRLAFKQTRDSEIIPLIYDGKTGEARKLAMGIQAQRYDKMRSIITELDKDAMEETERHVTESGMNARRAVWFSLFVGAIAIIVSVIMSMYSTKIIATPLTAISNIAERVVSGDLTVNTPVEDRKDEVGILSWTFRAMMERLQREIRDIMEAVNVLAASSSEIATTTAQLASGTEQTAVSVNETTTTIEEIRQTANVTSQKARQVSDIAQNAVTVSQNGARLVNETVEGINKIREQMEYIAETIVKLSEHNQAIGEIIAAVDDIAEQSNLLAVNAAIEAAKVGEQGKGFIIVAQEIKSLAEQSKQATKQVRSILNDIQKSSTAAVMSTEKGSKAVEAAVRQSAGTGDSIRELTRSISEASQAVMQIAVSNQQQLVGIDQVALAMNNIRQASTQNATSTKQVEITMKNLQDLGQRLKRMIEHYRV
ncbi:MAG: methyl-accepting chemotaxis protein [Nitrospirae bacterium]|nr:methyl-accepting chemotaxis protein [Nitrospirota bacterium]